MRLVVTQVAWLAPSVGGASLFLIKEKYIMLFFRNDPKKDSSECIPKHTYVNSLKEDNNLYPCRVGEIAIDDIVFDIYFLKITSKVVVPGNNVGYHLEAVDFLGDIFHAFAWETDELYTVNPDFEDDLRLYLEETYACKTTNK